LPPLSATHRYSACPFGPARYVPPEPFAVSTVTPLAADAALDVVDEDAGAAADVALLELELFELPHPAAIRAAVASAATPTMRNFAVLRLAIVRSQFAICSGPVRWTVS
jgi:hypothetical protein